MLARLDYRGWTYILIAMVVGLAMLSLVLEPGIRLISPLILPPLIASITTTPRRTAAVIALTLAATLMISYEIYDQPVSADTLLRIGVTVVGSGLALWTSILRERDLRTRRRMALIERSRTELEAARGMGEDLISFARSAALEFARWAFVDLRYSDGRVERFCEFDAEFAAGSGLTPKTDLSSAAVAYAERAAREGPVLIHAAEAGLIGGLFDGYEDGGRPRYDVMILPVTAGEASVTYFLVCPDPHPPWGEAELAQAASLARTAALAAQSDQLLDRLTFAQEELRASRDEIAAIIGGIADGVAAQSASGEMVYVNDVAARMFGFDSPDEMIGSGFAQVVDRMELRDEHGDPFDPQQLPSRRALRGEESPEALLRYVVKETGREWWTFVKARAVRDESGRPVMAISVIEDQTERRRGELAVQFLADISRELYLSSDPIDTATLLAFECVPAIADRCIIDLSVGESGLERVADQDGRVDGAPSGLSIQVATTGVPERLDESAGAKRLSAAFGVPEEEAPREVLIAPLMAHGRPVGTCSLALDRGGVRFTDFDVDTALELGRRAGIAVDAAWDAKRREQALSTLQKSLLPRRLPDLPGLELAARFRPAQVDLDVSGDFYDAFEMGDGSIALVIGDVCGKGPEAAAITALTRYTLRAEALRQSNPTELLRTLNEAMLEQSLGDRFCTVAIVRFRKQIGGESHVDVVSAGHPLPILVSDGGTEAIGEPGTLLGVVEQPELSVRTVEVRQGDALVLYTDGLAAGQTTDDVGFARELVSKIRTAGAEDLAAAIDEEAANRQQAPNRDDVAVLVAVVD